MIFNTMKIILCNQPTKMNWICVVYISVVLSTSGAVFLGSSEETLSQVLSTYDITIPIQVDEAGNFLSHNLKDVHRKKRSNDKFEGNDTMYFDGVNNENQDNLYFNFTAFGVSYNVELQNKRRLIAPGAKFVRYLSNGSVETLIDDKEVYTGRVRNEVQSSVAMTSFDGLAGYIKTEKGEFFIEPLDRQNENGEKNPQRHVVYEKRDLIYRKEGDTKLKSIFEESESLMQNSQIYEALNQNDSEKRHKRHSNKKKVYNIEVLLTADHTVADFHGIHGVKDYLITLMNIVDEIYHDETIGQIINIVIVKLSLLNGGDSKNLIAHDDPAISLSNVCNWAHDMYNGAQNDSESTYDHAIFLTRQKFGPTGMEGYAHVTGMCEPLRSCTLNHEDGFSSAFVVAHETGHVLGMQHDGENNKCGIETSMGSIMAPLVQAAFHRYHWSRCSQYELKKSIRAFDCLMNNPHAPDWGETPEYPGIYYSMDDQCRFDFGPGYKQCTEFPIPIEDVCRTLWCSHDDNPLYCKTKNGPPVDGTACADNMWCFKSHCVWRNNMRGAIHGAWGTWSNYEICSRSCGTGVMTRYRECNRPKPSYGGKKCRGISTEYGLCNKQKCIGAYDYRAEQCRFHQKKEYAHRRHTWLPYESHLEDLKCELFCVSKETTTILSMGSPVADGTRCSYDDPYSICINAECMKVGCDGIIGSAKRDDECGVCDGDGSQCKRIDATYRKIVRKPNKSYMKTITIPANARQVQIREATDTPTDILALKNRRTGRYVLNHKGAVIEGDLLKQFIDSETKWNYNRKRDRETLSTRGPLNVDYLLMVVVRNRTKSKKVRINYSYIIHSSLVDNDRYQYSIRKWYPCSVTCGDGTRLARYGCRNRATKKWVRKSYCPAYVPKKLRQRCSVDCEPSVRWDIGRWGTCSKTCGGIGQKLRTVVCQKKNKVGIDKTVDDAVCSNISEKPMAQKPCTAPTCPPTWSVGNWSLCSVSCGKGSRQRNVVCISRGLEVPGDRCLEEKPAKLDYCNMPGCTSCESNHSDTLCNLKSMAKFCSIAGYQRLCCATCRSRFGEFTGESRENKTTKRNSSRSPRSVTTFFADGVPNV